MSLGGQSPGDAALSSILPTLGMISTKMCWVSDEFGVSVFL